jgi:plastocyanin
MSAPRRFAGTRFRVARFACLVAVAVLVIGCARSAPPDASAVPTNQVTIVDNQFEAPVIEVAPGTAVTWTWHGSNPHNVVGDGWSSDPQTSGTFSHTFETAGTFDYVCQVHDGMAGRVVVGG